jgi:hypothetical protein
MIILKLILKKYKGRTWIGFLLVRIGQLTIYCEHGHETSGPMQHDEFIGWLRPNELLKKASDPWS